MRRLAFWAALASLPLAAALAQQPPAPTAPAAPSTSAPAPAATTPPPPPAWVARGVAEVVALDKVTARATPLSIRVGQSASFRTLTIAVRACDTRPPDQPPDATAFVDVTDSHAGAPQFHGWLLLSAPSVSMLQHPIYDLRLTGCHD